MATRFVHLSVAVYRRPFVNNHLTLIHLEDGKGLSSPYYLWYNIQLLVLKEIEDE